MINELSLRSLATETQEACCELFCRVVELASPLDPNTAYWICARYDDIGTAVGRSFKKCRDAIDALPFGDDRRRRVYSFLQRLQRFPLHSEPDTSHASGRARGLGVTHAFGGLALSIDRSPWATPTIPIVITDLLEGAGLTETQVVVRNASTKAHLAAHVDWVGLSAHERLSVLLSARPASHIDASKYSSAKHVRGSSNAERRENAAAAAGPGQFFAELARSPVTDDTIRSWEASALAQVRGRDPGVIVVQRALSLFWIYTSLSHEVGYASGGASTSELRVEWNDGHVHSHPRLRSSDD